ncbi:MAG: penicillin-binding protein activator [Deltaproteobacteria bacterium]|nr:penicillin-binding protein activator [Deltaproteobacteria bacterium]
MRAGAALALLLAAAFGLGCALLPGAERGVGADRRIVDDALRAAERDPAIARGRLAAFLRTHPGSPLFDDAALALAQLERAAGDEAGAESTLRAALARQPRGDRTDAVRVELADLLVARGASDAAWVEAQRVRLGLVRDSERPRAARLVAELARAHGDRRAEALALARLRDETPAEGAAGYDAEIGRALAELPTPVLLQVAEGLGARPSAALVWLEIGERAEREGNRALAIRAFARAERATLTPSDGARLERLGADLEGRAAPGGLADAPPRLRDVDGELPLADTDELSGAIGVVLPLSGPFGSVAEQTLRGVLLAAGVYGRGASADVVAAEEAAPAGGLRVVVRDSGGTAAGAAEAVRALAAEPDVRAVVGPLLTEEVQAAADAAQETGLPLLALTRHESVVRPGAGVFRLALTRRMEAESLAEYAVGSRGLRRIAILYPKDDYGREFEELLWQAVEARGGRVVGVAGYVPGGRDLAAPIRSLVGWSLLSEDQRARLAARDAELARAAAAGTLPAAGAAATAAGAGLAPATARGAQPLSGAGFAVTDPDANELPPIVDFDALFVPDAPDMVGALVPQLAEQGVDGVVLFGPSAWHHPALLRDGGTRLEGAFFTSSFDAAHPAALVQEFDRRYASAFGEEPTVFAAQGFDAANLVALQLARGASDRESLRRSLLATELYPGVSGPTTFDPDGNARKRPFLLGVASGGLVSLE